MSTAVLPALNALLNGTCAVLLVCGFALIRRRRRDAHRALMILATLVSAGFLVSYLVYHSRVGSVPYQGRGALRAVYFVVLISHTILAAAIVPLAGVTLYRALRGRFERHAAIARVTLPIWIYVSVTGVMIYLMLYRIPAD